MPDQQVEKNHRWLALFSLIGPLSLIFIDQTALPIALPTLQKDFELNFRQLQWIINAYLLPLATFILASGSMGDLFGHRRIFCLGLIIFTLASLGCSFKWTSEWLIMNRALQGIGGAFMIPTTLALLSQVFPPQELGKAMGIYGAFVALSLTIGPVIGGYLTEFFNWTFIFLINIPIALFTLPLVLLFHKKSKHSIQRFDWLGFILISFAIICLILAIMQSQDWSLLTISGLILISLIVFVIFILTERNIRYPLIDFYVFKASFFLNNAIIVFFYQFISTAVVFWSIYFQNSLSFTPFQAGNILLISNIPLLIITPLAGTLSDKIGAKRLIGLGGALLTLCFLIFTLYTDRMNLGLLLSLLLGFRCGTALILTPLFSATLKMVPMDKQGQASGILVTSRQMGSTFCIAFGSAMIDYFYSHRFSHFLENLAPAFHLNIQQFPGILSGAPSAMEKIRNLPMELASQILQVAHQSFNFGFSMLCLLFTLISLTIFFLSQRLPE